MCVLPIKVSIRKKSGNLFNDPRIYIYIYMCVCLCVNLHTQFKHLLKIRLCVTSCPLEEGLVNMYTYIPNFVGGYSLANG